MLQRKLNNKEVTVISVFAGYWGGFEENFKAVLKDFGGQYLIHKIRELLKPCPSCRVPALQQPHGTLQWGRGPGSEAVLGLKGAMGSSHPNLNLRQRSCVSTLWEAKFPFATRAVAIAHEAGWTSETDVYKS